MHGDWSFPTKTEFEFDLNEKIYKVEGRLIEEIIVSLDGTNTTTIRITRLRFYTKDRESPSYDGPMGETFTEEIKGYTLGYATGRVSQCIHQLQFIWYRTRDMD